MANQTKRPIRPPRHRLARNSRSTSSLYDARAVVRQPTSRTAGRSICLASGFALSSVGPHRAASTVVLVAAVLATVPSVLSTVMPSVDSWATTTAPRTAATRRRRRRSASGMSYTLPLVLVSLDRGQHRLGANAATGHQLSSGVADRGPEGRCPLVLLDQHGGRVPGLYRRRQVGNVLLGEDHGEFGLAARSSPNWLLSRPETSAISSSPSSCFRKSTVSRFGQVRRRPGPVRAVRSRHRQSPRQGTPPRTSPPVPAGPDHLLSMSYRVLN